MPEKLCLKPNSFKLPNFDHKCQHIINPLNEERDAALFFGREQLTGEMRIRIAEQPDRIHTLVSNSGVATVFW